MSFEFESDDDECSMPELGNDVSVVDLCCDADDESSRHGPEGCPEPRRLTLEQRRRLNLYSKPNSLPVAKVTDSGKKAGWPLRDTPTIHEEESVQVAAEAPEPTRQLRQRMRVRTISEPTHQHEQGWSKLRTRYASSSQTPGSPGSRWPRALSLVFQNLKNDPWRGLPVTKRPEEIVVRHRYNAHKRQWIQDKVQVKLEEKSFNRGAMRECFRLKKLSTFSKFDSWNSRACNYVAKRYFDDVDSSVYFEDVRLQMNAKLWAQEYNRNNPPKKVDIMQMCVIEFVNREGAPLYHLEHHIEGDYIKYNSNSGFVDEHVRSTPHALSHFTFERSGHQLIVVDIQGVDDIYTDPQIHTAGGTEYGDGNLGVRGMALFFHSHVCNDICRMLQLSPFDKSQTELSEPPSPVALSELTCVRAGVFGVGSPASPPSVFDSGCGTDDEFSEHAGGSVRRLRHTSAEDEMTAATLTRSTSNDGARDLDSLAPEEEMAAISAALKRRERPSCVQGNLLSNRVFSRSRSDSGSECGGAQPLPGMPETRCHGPILGRIHHELARLHESGRFANPLGEGVPLNFVEEAAAAIGLREIDWKAALFHEGLAADLGVVEAAVNLARLHLGLPADCLQEIPAGSLDRRPRTGHEYMEKAARLGDRAAMLYLARAFDRGDSVDRDWYKAAHFYQRALESAGQQDKEGGYDCLDTPPYLLRARLAELYLNGGSGLDPDPATSYECYSEAAEEAMGNGNGKLATKYYMLAEEASALIPDDE